MSAARKPSKLRKAKRSIKKKLAVPCCERMEVLRQAKAELEQTRMTLHDSIDHPAKF